MNNITLKRVGMVALLSAAFAFGASAQTFLYEGIVYKATGNKLQAQKITGNKPPVPENGACPTAYTGDIVIPDVITYNGVDYTVTDLSTAFKDQPITSIVMSNTVTKVGAGAFQGCTGLTSVTISSQLAKLEQNMFNGCTGLTEIVIPGTVTSALPNSLFKGCVNLAKITFAEGTAPLDVKVNAFAEGGNSGITDLIINRAFNYSVSAAMNDKPWRGIANLKNVTFGGTAVEIEPSMFEGCSALESVTFNSDVTTMGTNAFAGTALTNVTLPNSITTIPSGAFGNARNLATVTLGDAVTTIDALAFRNSGVKNINLPASLETIGDMAFSGAKLEGVLALPENVKRIGQQAFANNTGLTAVEFPATIASIGDGAFMGCTNIATFAVAEGNENYQVVDGVQLREVAAPRLVSFAPAATATSVDLTAYTELAPYALYGASNVEAITAPNCTVFGDYALAFTGLKSLSLKGQVGRYVASNNTALTSASLQTTEIPFGVVNGCTALTDVTLPAQITVVKQDAFKGCTSLKTLNLGNVLAILEADCFANSGITNLTVGSTYPAAMAEGVFTEGCGITATVPADLADAYRAADGWRNLTIVGDANIVAGGADMGMPAGLYYAGDDDMLHCVYSDGETDTYDVGGIPHTFQLLEYSNRIYGASAGKKFVYSATGDVDGDGKLFYISKVGGETFQAVVLDNTGNNAYKDPFGLYIYGEDLYVNDRNVCIRKIPASAIALPQNYPSWMENNWMYFYGAPWSYGCIKCGFAITSVTDAAGVEEPLYWVGMKYNGEGIFRFRTKNIGTGSDIDTKGSQPAEAPLLTGITPIFTTFNVDQAHGHLYLYIEIASATNAANRVKAGLYRVNLSDIEANPNPSSFFDLNPVLIDGSPVKYEGSATNEHVGISQLAFDAEGKYMYWCYRAPTPAEAAENEGQTEAQMLKGKYYWADQYDENNPLHHSGIKRILLGQDQPVVEMVAPGVSGYGVAPVNFEGSTRPSGVNSVIAPEAQLVTVAAGSIAANEAVSVAVYDLTGVMVATAQLAAGEALTLDLPAGMYIVAANNAAASQTVKVVL